MPTWMLNRYVSFLEAVQAAVTIAQHTGTDMAVQRVSDNFALVERDAVAGIEADTGVVAVVAATVLPNSR